jgi:NAD(P)-dependent dehydrogenase (short-subunit alcohol dehydrogenase family)
MKTIHFTAEDLDLFSAASLDRNPLHVSEDYARRTPYGGRVVFGILSGLTALGRTKVADRADCVLASVEFEFFDTALLGIDYSVHANDSGPSQSTVRVMDGRRPVLEAVLTFRPGRPSCSWQPSHCPPSRSEAADLSGSQLKAGHHVRMQYSPLPKALNDICSRIQLTQNWATTGHVAALMWTSYLVGMDLPGKRALFSRALIEFKDCPQNTVPFDCTAEIVEISDMGELTIRGEIACDGITWVKATLGAHVRADLPPLTTEAVEMLVGRSSALAGKVALVTGGSRGLGSALVRALALQGCTVLLNFVRHRSEAEHVRDSLAQTLGEVLLEQGDVADLARCEETLARIHERLKRLDFLICNASAPLLPLWLETSAAQRVNAFIYKSVAMVSAPIMVFAPLLAASKGWNVLISSTAVVQPHPYFPHYVVAKCAAEAVARAASTEYRAVTSLLVRPSRLLTDLTNTPLGRKGALAPEIVAATVLKRLLGAPSPGKVEILDQFGT